MPSKYGLWLNDEECLFPAFPGSRQENPEKAIEISNLRSGMSSVQDGELLAKREVLESQFRAEPKGRGYQGEDAQNRQDHVPGVSGPEAWKVNIFKAVGIMANHSTSNPQ